MFLSHIIPARRTIHAAILCAERIETNGERDCARGKKRTQRRSDGTVSVHGVRFEIPSQFAHLQQVFLRFARWDLTCAYLVDPKDSLTVLSPIRPQNKQKNADGKRRARVLPVEAQPPKEPIPPLLRSILADYQKTGLPPAYIPGAAACEKMEKKS